MRILVFVKYVPDAAGDRSFTDGNVVDRSVDGLLSELDEYAIEEALKITEATDGDTEVVALTVGPDDAVDAVRKALQIGVDAGVHILDNALEASDALSTSRVLAAAAAKLHAEEPFDLIITGLASTDGSMSVVPVQVAELLGWPAATQASEVEVGEGTVTVRRDGDTSSQRIEVSLPALVSVTDQINEPRYPSFKGIMAAKKKPLDEYELVDLDVPAEQVGAAGASTVVQEITARPPRTAGEIVTDEGDGGTKLIDFLAGRKLV